MNVLNTLEPSKTRVMNVMSFVIKNSQLIDLTNQLTKIVAIRRLSTWL